MTALSPVAVIFLIYLIIATIGVIFLTIALLKAFNKLNKIENDKHVLNTRLKNLQDELNSLHDQAISNGSLHILEHILDNLPQPTFSITTAGLISFANESFCKLIEKTPNDISAKYISDIVDIYDQTTKEKFKFESTNSTESKTSSKLPDNLILRLSDAHEKHISGFIVPFVKDDYISNLYVFLHDDTQILKAGEEINSNFIETKNQLELLQTQKTLSEKYFDLTPHAILMVDGSGKITYANPSAIKMMHVFEVPLLGLNASESIVFKDQKDNRIYFDDLSKFEVSEIPKWIFLNSMGYKIPVGGYILKVNDNNNRNDRILILRDATLEYNREIEDKTFFSSVAHDLRSPLSTVRGILELLSEGQNTIPQSQYKEFINGAKQSIIALINLVNDLLNVSRIDQEKLSINKETFPVLLFLEEIITTYEQQAREKKLYLSLEITDIALPDITTDKEKLREILNNLISNAIKYTHQGQILVSAIQKDSNIEIRVKDTGNGISPENIPLLFRKFQQVGSSRLMSNAKSTGLGLYISKSFTELLKGSLTLELSEVGKGSTFLLTLPISHKIN